MSPMSRLFATLLLGSLCLSARPSAPVRPAGPIDTAGMRGPSCMAGGCHADLAAPTFRHAPAIQGDCVPCHVEADDSASTGAVSEIHPRLRTLPANASLCGECHTDTTLDAPFVHAPFRTSCRDCHDPHGGSKRFFLKAESPGELCAKCHADVAKGAPLLHGPVALGNCLDCHSPHTSTRKGLLSRPEDRLCAYCHVSFGLRMKEAKSIHEPVRAACPTCHQPHAASFEHLLSSEQPRLCGSCHGDIKRRAEKSAFPHKAMYEGRECSRCHDAHFSAQSRLLKRPSMELCLSCHEEGIKTADGRQLSAVGLKLKAKKYHHGPIRQGDCTPCHDAHGSDDPRLMKAPFPETFYADYKPGIYDLCFRCHDRALVELKETLATGFRNGSRNLHYEHVNRDKGRSCRACHDEHASSNPFQIRESLPYGQWELELRIQATDTGATCLAGCHKPRKYDRVNPVPEERKTEESQGVPRPSEPGERE